MTEKTTPLHEFHLRNKAKMVEFHGWTMPLSYEGAGIIAEHKQTRDACSLFDVSHMCQMRLEGEDVASALNDILPLSANALKVGRNKYTFACEESGGIIDDMIVGNDDHSFFIVCNASRASVVIPHLRQHIDSSRINLEQLEGRGLIAIQGPKAEETLAAIEPSCKDLRFMGSIEVIMLGSECRVSRSGYTGEDGFEISVPGEKAEQLADALLEAGPCKPAGLGARDTLRIEAGLCLYGNDIDTTTLPAEAQLGWAIPPSARKRASFVGAKKVLEQLEQGPARKLVGLSVRGKAPLRQGTELQVNGGICGKVTSGSHSPTLGHPVALALVDSESSEMGQVPEADVRGKKVESEIVALPFVPHQYKVSKPAS